MSNVKLPNVRRIRKDEYLTLFENAIVDKYGFEYHSDSANISWGDLEKIQKTIKENPYKFYYSESAYDNILCELEAYIKSQAPKYDLEDEEFTEDDLVTILNVYNSGIYELDQYVHIILQNIQEFDENEEKVER